MTRPLIGIISNLHVVDGSYRTHAGGVMNCEAVSDVCDCIPALIPADPRYVSVEELLETYDGFVLTGGRPNVHPSEYGEDETAAHGTFDRARDAITLPLVRACVQRGQPFLGICRGFQEVAVAMGSTLHPEIRDLPGRMNHRMPPDGTQEEKFALRHKVSFTEGGVFHKLMGAREVMTNTLHGQGVIKAGTRFVVDGLAPDGTPEAAYVEGAPGYTLAVQWHPEYHAAQDPVSRPLFEGLGQAARAWQSDRRARPALRSA
ncbi:gamma-glutamyl-gamma-aminobutyrate hydrolase family protein [Pseudooceanicola sp. CBS1P-1]|uniref:Gamma-glutamyl-gamma-aminobutyrate hydrolase family protein n=1 Tax=Pseudooceanicola albus TaxID=2692189 RepID=A0A6L7G0S2_9RHOB|nr:MULTISPECIES: gamma-glutamyl-gamma-aminobutyrate hydrolase family protein [Pseudooceanicola]MBT9382557.1 gamma-glutamyl-gamma-aminobutyrate hydrolase family protein [Pseudooceanicola endophyticus]MXN17098.1 gamma-glutamyl-gamma-aminobutyrate hydrolase family protein [Pseudooceanicola albus]